MADDLRERMLSWRTEHHVSQAGFARLSGLSRCTIRNLEQGATVPTRANANAILSVINGEPATWSETVRERRTRLAIDAALDGVTITERTAWQCPACLIWLAPHVDEHRCDGTGQDGAQA
jgi:transcriptional regulator with XRE-family HTH domain